MDEANIYNARRALNRELKLALDEAGIEIPFPQVVVWQGKEPAAKKEAPAQTAQEPDEPQENA